ncbi:MAG: T9SS type A sorting domain-containing protein [Flavobacteriales bacterium]|nr:T9SS type A sorting domain-containing protein [Flavobacteriales bacterium]
MKTISLSFALLLVAAFSMAQCTPTTGFTGWGMDLLPAELAPVESCFGCGSQERVISIRTLVDTVLSVEVVPGNPPLIVTVFADRFRLDSIGGLPVGLSYTTDAAYDTTYDAVLNPFGYWVNGGDTTNGFIATTGCITISGSEEDWAAAVGGGPNNDGEYPLGIYIDVRAANYDPPALANTAGYNTWISEMGVLLDVFADPNITTNGIQYAGPTLIVTGSGLGIANGANGNFGVVKNQPNPFTGNTVISFELKENVASLQFAVYDVLGAIVHSEKLNPTVGNNRINYSSNGLPTGIYVYTLSDGNTIVTRKMNVQ